MSVNKAVLVGRLGADPEIRYTQSGKAVCSFSLATQRGKDAETQWHQVVAWEERAEFCARNLSKGRQVYVEGEISYEKWTDRDGVARVSTKIRAWNIQPTDQKPTGSGHPPRGHAGADLAGDLPF